MILISKSHTLIRLLFRNRSYITTGFSLWYSTMDPISKEIFKEVTKEIFIHNFTENMDDIPNIYPKYSSNLMLRNINGF